MLLSVFSVSTAFAMEDGAEKLKRTYKAITGTVTEVHGVQNDPAKPELKSEYRISRDSKDNSYSGHLINKCAPGWVSIELSPQDAEKYYKLLTNEQEKTEK